jgi:hypothetical protein
MGSRTRHPEACEALTWERAHFLQARSALRSAIILERTGGDVCQTLHNLQMSVENVGKAYEARHTGLRPAFSHAAFSNNYTRIRLSVLSSTRLRRRLTAVRGSKRSRLAATLRSLQPSAAAIEALNPVIAGANGKNSEYPWNSVAGPKSPTYARFGRSLGKLARLKVIAFLDILLACELNQPPLTS